MAKKSIQDDLKLVEQSLLKLELAQVDLKAKRAVLSKRAAEQDAANLFEAVYAFAAELREGKAFECYQAVMDSWSSLSEHDPGALSKFGRADSFGVPDSDEKYFLVNYFLQWLNKFDTIVDAVQVLKKGEGKPGNIFLDPPETEREEVAA